MVDPINISALLSVAAMITALGGAWLTVRKIQRDSARDKKIQAAAVLQSAKEADLLLQTRLDNKIHDLATELKVLKESNEKDIAHLKETHTSELKSLGEKIEVLRDELRQQSKNILELLTKMIGKE
jgi:phage host-nuclease inhibitor protein Gam